MLYTGHQGCLTYDYALPDINIFRNQMYILTNVYISFSKIVAQSVYHMHRAVMKNMDGIGLLKAEKADINLQTPVIALSLLNDHLL